MTVYVALPRAAKSGTARNMNTVSKLVDLVARLSA